MDASQGRHAGPGLLERGDGLLVLLLRALVQAVEPGHAAFLAFLLPLVGPSLVELGPILEELGLARGQQRLHVVMLDDGEGIALLDLHALVDIHSLDPARYFRADHRLRPRFQVPGRAQELRGLARGHPLDQPAGHFRPGADLVVLLVGEGAARRPRSPSGISQSSQDRNRRPPPPRRTIAGLGGRDRQEYAGSARSILNEASSSHIVVDMTNQHPPIRSGSRSRATSRRGMLPL